MSTSLSVSAFLQRPHARTIDGSSVAAQASTSATTASSSVDPSVSQASSGLAALLSRVQLVHGGSQVDASGATAEATDPKRTLGHALSTLLGALGSDTAGGQGTPAASAGAATGAVDSAIQTLRAVLVPATTEPTASTEPAPTPAIKPNLDALKRVLAHYAAQSAAATATGH